MKDLCHPGSSMPLLHFRSKAHLRCIERGWIDEEAAEDEEGIEDEDALFAPVTVHAFHRARYSVYIISMPTPIFVPESYLVAIVHRDDEPKSYMEPSPSTRYFTLELGHSERPFLCEWYANGTRKNHGPGPPPAVQPLAEAVFDLVFGMGSPSCHRSPGTA